MWSLVAVRWSTNCYSLPASLYFNHDTMIINCTRIIHILGYYVIIIFLVVPLGTSVVTVKLFKTYVAKFDAVPKPSSIWIWSFVLLVERFVTLFVLTWSFYAARSRTCWRYSGHYMWRRSRCQHECPSFLASHCVSYILRLLSLSVPVWSYDHAPFSTSLSDYISRRFLPNNSFVHTTLNAATSLNARWKHARLSFGV